MVESLNCSNLLFLRNSERKTAAHFSWNCSKGISGEKLGQDRRVRGAATQSGTDQGDDGRQSD
ncbi:MAG: hypothetical protein E5W93_09040, partial [Mesorhizobium sp.]